MIEREGFGGDRESPEASVLVAHVLAALREQVPAGARLELDRREDFFSFVQALPEFGLRLQVAAKIPVWRGIEIVGAEHDLKSFVMSLDWWNEPWWFEVDRAEPGQLSTLRILNPEPFSINGYPAYAVQKATALPRIDFWTIVDAGRVKVYLAGLSGSIPEPVAP